MQREDLRNIAIIAHVDHGKTTLVDQMLKQGGAFEAHEEVVDRVMDSGDIERERGITILAKNTSVRYNGVKINIVDTPGHADFGGEVERILKMVNGVVLLVDAFEGAMPQTRFVLSKALELGHRVIVAVNKTDRPDARTGEIEEEVLELFMDLNATEDQLYSPFVYCSGRDGTASLSPEEQGTDLTPLFDTILEHIPAPEGEEAKPLELLISSIDYNDYVGRIGIGRIENGSIALHQDIILCDYSDEKERIKGRVVALYQIEGLDRVPAKEASVGDIVAISGIEEITIGHTICDPNHPNPLPFVKISEPTVEMYFSVNNSPFAGQDGKYVTSRQIRERLHRELLKDVSLRVEDTDSPESFRVCGRGEMHLSILIETMRREGYEFQVGTPKVLFREIDGKRYEPIEEVVIDVPEEYVGSVMESLGHRKGELLEMLPQGDRMRLEFLVPSRGLFGYRNEFMTATHGEGIFTSTYHDYQPYKGAITRRPTGSLIAFEAGESTAYGLYQAQDRGTLFIQPGVPVYEGMVVGMSPRSDDMVVNVCRKKQMTNVRAAGSDDALRLVPPRTMSLEESIEFITDDELIEVTPKSIRLRKMILDKNQRRRAEKNYKNV